MWWKIPGQASLESQGCRGASCSFHPPPPILSFWTIDPSCVFTSPRVPSGPLKHMNDDENGGPISIPFLSSRKSYRETLQKWAASSSLPRDDCHFLLVLASGAGRPQGGMSEEQDPPRQWRCLWYRELMLVRSPTGAPRLRKAPIPC